MTYGISEPDKRTPPVQEEVISTPGPVLLANSYEGGDQEFQALLEWRLPKGSKGRLHELKLTSTNDAKTRWRITLNSRQMSLPPDKSVLTTPATYSWLGAEVEDRAIRIEVMSTDGTAITVTSVVTGEII